MDNLQIRRGMASDAAVLAEFAARTFAETFAADNRPEDLQAHLESAYGVTQQTQELTDPNTVTLLALKDQTLVGYAQIRRSTPPECITQAQPIELHRLYIDRSAHGSGAAQKLMEVAKQAARELGGHHFWLGVWERNPRAIAFYKKTGFFDVGSHDFYVGPDRQTDRVLVTALEG